MDVEFIKDIIVKLSCKRLFQINFTTVYQFSGDFEKKHLLNSESVEAASTSMLLEEYLNEDRLDGILIPENSIGLQMIERVLKRNYQDKIIFWEMNNA